MATAGTIQRVNEDLADRQFTAKDLIGKELYDNGGKRIGEVKDIVIASSVNPQLASGLASKSGARSSSTSDSTTAGTTRSATASAGGVGATGSVNTSDSGVTARGSLGETNTAASTGRDMARDAQSMMGAMSENAAIVSYGGFLGAGDDLLRVPLSQLSYDSSNERITINVTESELSSLPEASDVSRSVAE
jgi:hypothetical protein